MHLSYIIHRHQVGFIIIFPTRQMSPLKGTQREGLLLFRTFVPGTCDAETNVFFPEAYTTRTSTVLRPEVNKPLGSFTAMMVIRSTFMKR